MNIGKLKGPEKKLQMTGKHKLQECKSGVLLYLKWILMRFSDSSGKYVY